MENETKQTNTNEQEPDIFAQKLREADSLYAILSGCTKEPYVYCDPETMDPRQFPTFGHQNGTTGR